MYTNNPNLLEKLAWSKIDDLRRDARNTYNVESRTNSKSKMLVLTGLLVALAWMISVIL